MIWKQGYIPSVALILGAIFVGALFAQESPDVEFAQKAAAGAMAEVKLGQLAQRKSSNSAIQKFGKHMDTNERKVERRLKSIAVRMGITLPADVSKEDAEIYEKFSKMSEPEFDIEFERAMVTEHDRAIALFKTEACEGRNRDLKNLAVATLPTLQNDLKMAYAMQNTPNSSQISR